jgi:UDP-N-acetylglucosamine 1-carboxyvinyltransferase
MAQKMILPGGRRLVGEVNVSGSKNAALPILAATLLTREESVLENVSYLKDVETLIQLLENLGAHIERHQHGVVVVRVKEEKAVTPTPELVHAMRASICLLGPLIARRKQAKLAMPGGCAIGARPIDLHVKGIKALGAEVRVSDDFLEARAEELHGAEIFLGGAFGSSWNGKVDLSF